jgi:ParB family transcriptional regulator, chromosome partitioning protein
MIANSANLISISSILPNPEQPRKVFDKTKLAELANSIRENGVIQPVVVEAAANGRYILHDGERRLRAAKQAGLAMIPCVVVPALNGTARQDRLVRALVTNIQRDDLNPVEEARAFQVMLDLGIAKNEIALKLGVSSARVAQRLQLLLLDEEIQALIEQDRLSHDARLATALLDIPDRTARIKMAKSLADRGVAIKPGVEACQRLTGSLAAVKIDQATTPAMYLAVKRAGELRRPIWNAFAQVGNVPPWPLVEVCARDTCARCPLSDAASEATCRGCALVEFLRQAIGSTH